MQPLVLAQGLVDGAAEANTLDHAADDGAGEKASDPAS
jgi:hypothetical protein